MICSICLVFRSSGLALVAASPEGLEAQPDLLHAYAAKWKLTVNIDKARVVVFQQSSTNQQVYPPPIYNGALIILVESFQYLVGGRIASHEIQICNGSLFKHSTCTISHYWVIRLLFIGICHRVQ